MEAAEKREKERKKAEEKAKLKRLQEIIEEEKNKLHKEGHKKKQYVCVCNVFVKLIGVYVSMQ